MVLLLHAKTPFWVRRIVPRMAPLGRNGGVLGPGGRRPFSVVNEPAAERPALEVQPPVHGLGFRPRDPARPVHDLMRLVRGPEFLQPYPVRRVHGLAHPVHGVEFLPPDPVHGAHAPEFLPPGLARLVQSLARLVAPGAAPRLRNERVPQPFSEESSFAELKGRLRLPVRGELANRFGSPRADGGVVWKGLFIAARAGEEVRAIADGRVVFADWLRGFGNLLIVDHGDAYMSLYGNNEALYKRVGDSIRAGDPVAAVGATGGNADSGLYFELRHQGRPLDPLEWVSTR